MASHQTLTTSPFRARVLDHVAAEYEAVMNLGLRKAARRFRRAHRLHRQYDPNMRPEGEWRRGWRRRAAIVRRMRKVPVPAWKRKEKAAGERP